MYISAGKMEFSFYYMKISGQDGICFLKRIKWSCPFIREVKVSTETEFEMFLQNFYDHLQNAVGNTICILVYPCSKASASIKDEMQLNDY